MSLPLKPDNLACAPSYALALPSSPPTPLTAALTPHFRLPSRVLTDLSHWSVPHSLFLLLCTLFLGLKHCSLPPSMNKFPRFLQPSSGSLLAELKRGGHCLGRSAVFQSLGLIIPDESQTTGLELRDSTNRNCG